MTTYKCAYCDATFDVDADDDPVEMPVAEGEQPSFQKPSDLHSDLRAHVLAEHPGQPISRVRVSG